MNERRARLVGGPADGEQRMVSVDKDGTWPAQVRSTPTDGGPGTGRSFTYQLTPNPTGEGDLVYTFVANAPDSPTGDG